MKQTSKVKMEIPVRKVDKQPSREQLKKSTTKKNSSFSEKVMPLKQKMANHDDIKNEAREKTKRFFEAAQKMQESVKNINPFLTDPDQNIFNKFSKMGSMPKMDNEKMLNMYKKNMETLGEANKLAIDVMQRISQLQGQFMRQTFEEIDQVVRENLAFKNVDPESQVKKNTERFQGAVKRAMDHSTQVSQIMLKSNQDLFKTVQNRFDEGMKEFQNNFNKTKH